MVDSRSLSPWKKAAGLLLAAGFVIFFARRGLNYAAGLRGQGYASESWRSSRLVKQVSQLDTRIPIFTNGFDVIYFYTHRLSRSLPERPAVDPEVVIHKFAELAVRRKAAVVLFNNISRTYLVSEEELLRTNRFELLHSFADGKIYRAW